MNPESGTTSYTYNADGSVATRTDARNQHIEYSYDSYKRVTQIRKYNSSGVEQTCQRVDLYYDTTPTSFNLGSYTQNGWGRPSAAQWGNSSSCTGGDFKELYSYNTAGKMTKKRLRWSRQSYADKDLEAIYTYNTLGQIVSTQYPNSGPTFTYTFDSMARPVKLTSAAVDWVKDVVYNTAGQITSMKYTKDGIGDSYVTETNEYNILGQMTRRRAQEDYFGSWLQDRTYTFSATNNDGRIAQMADAVSGETVVYQYDSLKRIISASTTGPEWGQSFGYDPFGNLLTQTVTKGSAPNMAVAVNGANNRITTGGYSYDANGNLTASPNLTMTYDVENRLSQATHSQNGTDQYVYDPSGRRVWKNESRVFFYSVDGTMLTSGNGYNVYFAGKLIWAESTPGGWYTPPGPVSLDRLGSRGRHFPYGDEPAATANNRVKFATYYRDETTTLDYAQQRYYYKSIGRFTSPDPYRASGGPADPQSWNRYAYVAGDPVNFYDPSGLIAEIPVADIREPTALSREMQLFFIGDMLSTYASYYGRAAAPSPGQRMWDLYLGQSEIWRRELRAKIDTMAGSHCMGVLEGKDKTLGDLRVAVEQTGFMRLNGYEANLSMREATGNPQGGRTSVASWAMPGDTYAFVPVLPNGVIPELIVLDGNLTLLADKEFQRNTLLGELLHIVFQKGDTAMLGFFGIATVAGESPSKIFHNWVDGDCGGLP